MASSTTKRKRTYNPRLIKATWPYTVEEIADLYGLHVNTVLRWLGEGLVADRQQRPFLIRGDDLIRFLTERQQRSRQTCRPSELFCFKCRSPREAYLGMADIVIESPTRLKIKAVCGVCDSRLNKSQPVSALPEIRRRFGIQELTGAHLIECSRPDLNSDLEE